MHIKYIHIYLLLRYRDFYYPSVSSDSGTAELPSLKTFQAKQKSSFRKRQDGIFANQRWNFRK